MLTNSVQWPGNVKGVPGPLFYFFTALRRIGQRILIPVDELSGDREDQEPYRGYVARYRQASFERVTMWHPRSSEAIQSPYLKKAMVVRRKWG
jgi:hypothetical protein